MNKKAGLISTISMVMSSQLGMGVFMLSSSLATLGILGISGVIFAGIFGIILSLMFFYLFKYIHELGFHQYIASVLGKEIAFFVSWIYWLVSCVGNITYIIGCSSYFLCLLINNTTHAYNIFYQILSLFIVAGINFFGSRLINFVDIITSAVKMIGLMIIPVMVFCKFSLHDLFSIFSNCSFIGMGSIIHKAMFLSMWGFIGMESIIANADKVRNPNKTLPKAFFIGNIIVILIYVMNILGIILLIPMDILSNTVTPYADATSRLFTSDKVIYLTYLIPLCISFNNFNIWLYSESNFTEQLAKDKLLPKIFLKRNKYGTSYFGLLAPTAINLIIIVMSVSFSLKEQIECIIDFSVFATLTIYLICAIALLKKTLENKNNLNVSFSFSTKSSALITAVVTLFLCMFFLFACEKSSLLLYLLFIVTALPCYLYMKFFSKHKYFK